MQYRASTASSMLHNIILSILYLQLCSLSFSIWHCRYAKVLNLEYLILLPFLYPLNFLQAYKIHPPGVYCVHWFPYKLPNIPCSRANHTLVN